MEGEERERKLQAGRERLAKYQQKKNAKKSSKKSKPSKPAEQSKQVTLQQEDAFPADEGNNEMTSIGGSGLQGQWSGGGGIVLDAGSGDQLEGGLSDGRLPSSVFPADDFASDDLSAAEPEQNGFMEKPAMAHSDLINNLRQEMDLERDARQRSEEELRSKLSLQTTTIQELERQLEQSKLVSIRHKEVSQRLQAEHAEALRRIQQSHLQEVQSVRAEEQRKRAEQVQSLTSRLESQHKEETDALHEQVQTLQASAPADTGQLQQMAVLMREQYQQESASKATEHKRELDTLTDKHRQEITQLQQQSVKQMEAFRNQVQESVSAQVNQFHSQYQTALGDLRKQLDEAVQKVKQLETEKADLAEQLSANEVDGRGQGELQSTNESLSNQLSNLTTQYNTEHSELVALRQQVSASHASGHQQELESARVALHKFEEEKTELLSTVSQLEAELNQARESHDSLVEDHQRQLRDIQSQEETSKASLVQEVERLRSQCVSQVTLLESEKSLVTNLTADLEKALSHTGLLEAQLQSLHKDFDKEKQLALSREQELENELSQAEEKHASLQEAHSQLQQQMQESLSLYARQVEELASAANEDSAAPSAVSELRAAYEEQFEQLRLDFESQEESLKQQHEREMADLSARQATASASILEELEQERNQCVQAESGVSQLKEDLRTVAEERSALETRNTWLEQRVSELSGQNLASIAEAKSRHEDVCRQHEAERVSWTDTEHGLRDQLATMEQEFASTKRQLAVSEAVAREQPRAADLAAKLDVANMERHQLQLRVQELEAAASAPGNAEDVISKCRAEITRLGRQLEEKDGELSERSEECARLEGEISQSLADLGQMQSHMDKMAQEVESQRTNAGKLAQERRQLLDSHEEEIAKLNSRVCHLEKALSEQEQTATEKTALVAELESRVTVLQTCEEDLKVANSEVEHLRSRLASWQPPAVEAVDSASPVSATRQDQLQSMLEQQKQALEAKLAEKSRLDLMLEEQRNALVQQLLEKNKLESLLQEKSKLENELLRQRSLLEKELACLDKPASPESS